MLVVAVVNSLMVWLLPLGGHYVGLVSAKPWWGRGALTPPVELWESVSLDLPPGCINAKWEPSSVETRQNGVWDLGVGGK